MIGADVYIWGTKVGSLTYQDNSGLPSFQYSREFMNSGIELSPIKMPLSTNVYSFPELRGEAFRGLPGLVADSLPDKFGNAVIAAWLSSEGRSIESFTPIEKLCYIGSRGMGALEYVPSTYSSLDEGESIQVSKLASLASEILADRKKLSVNVTENGMNQILKVGTSAGGARAKAIVAWNEDTGEVRSGQIDAGEGFSYWILKFDVQGNSDKEAVDPPEYTTIEYAYYLMAISCGIEMNECRLIEDSGKKHFAAKRFDRTKDGKLHMQSLAAIGHFDYNIPAIVGYEECASIMRSMGMGMDCVEKLYRRMVFNVFAENNDDHVKNVSFLMDRRGKWKLSPAYDMAYAYNPQGAWTSGHQMTINGKRQDITVEDMLRCAVNMNIEANDAKTIIAEVGNVTSKWKTFAERAGLSEEKANMIYNRLQIHSL